MVLSLSPFAPKNSVSRDGYGRPVPRHPAHSAREESDWLVLSHEISPTFHGGVHFFTPSTAIGSVPSYGVTHLRTDDVHCREAAGAGPVALKIVPATGAAFSGFTMDQLLCTSLFQHPLSIMKWDVNRSTLRGGGEMLETFPRFRRGQHENSPYRGHI